MENILILLITGCIGGFMNSIAGGGTLVTFPALLLIGIPSVPANATSTAALLPATLGSIVGYKNHLNGVAPYLKLFAPVSFIGGLIGGILLVATPSDTFDVIAPFLILFATLLFMAQNAFSIQRTQWHSIALLIQFAVAVYGGYFGAGIGILMLASLGMLGFNHIHQMNTIKVILGFLINSVATAYFVASGIIFWHEAAWMAAGAIAGGYGGARFAQKISQDRVRALITITGLIISAIMFYKNLPFTDR
jgi:uncharacterized membrane protein YfcA